MSSLAFSILIALCLVLVAVAAICLSFSPRFAGKAVTTHRTRAEQQFSSYSAELTGSTGALSGQTARVLSKSESLSFYNFEVHNYVLTVVGVSPEGQHFLFKSNEKGKPYVKLIPEHVALRQGKGEPWSRRSDA
jgi:hypothetical protein